MLARASPSKTSYRLTRKSLCPRFSNERRPRVGWLMRLVTFRQAGVEEIGVLTDADSRIVRLQAAEELRSGSVQPHFQSMLAFLRGASESRDVAARAVEFAMSQRPEGVILDRPGVETLSP